MPTDTKRNAAPEKTENYLDFVATSDLDYEILRKNLSDKAGFRSDGRTRDEHRKMYSKTGIVTQAKGSAYIEIGRTKILVSVFEPREIPRLSEFTPNGEIYCEFKFAPFSCPERRGHQMDGEEKDLSAILKRSLEPAVCRHEFPNFQVDVYALILDNDGSCLSGAVTAAGLAMADAGIPMYDVITSVTLGIHNESIFLDPTLEEEKFCRSFFPGKTEESGLISLSYMPTHGQASETTLTGAFGIERAVGSVNLLVSKCTEISLLSRRCLIENVRRTLNEEESATGIS